MGNQKVLDVLNSLDVIESQGGEDAYALVENNREAHDLLTEVGVPSEVIDKYGDKETFCIYALAFGEKYADFFYNEKLITTDDAFEIKTDNDSSVILFEHEGKVVLGISGNSIAFDIEVLEGEQVERIRNVINNV